MKLFLICFSLLLSGLVSQAQTQTASLNIILTDLQSVKYGNVSAEHVTPDKRDNDHSASLQILNSSTSQIKQIDSKNSEYERLYKEFYSEESTHPLMDNSNSYKLTASRLPSSKVLPDQPKTNLVIYQIDPR